MWPIMIANVLIEIGWLSASVSLILNNHPVYGCICLLGALISGFSCKTSKTTTSNPDNKPMHEVNEI